MRKLFLSLIALIASFTLVGVAKAEEKVKVYIFEAGGCPACEAQIDYLEGLDSYKEKFEIVKKELYVDHIDWEKGADYDLGVKVVEEFQKAGFTDATYQATPLVVVSDIYANNGYNDSLESVIDEAYEQGDKDAVKCIEDGKEKCVTENSDSDSKKSSNSHDTIIIIGIFVVLIAGMAGLVVFSKK